MPKAELKEKTKETKGTKPHSVETTQSEVDSSRKTARKVLWTCCSGLVIIAVIFIVLGIIGYYFSDEIKEKIGTKTTEEPINLAPAYFMNTALPDYTITEAEEQQFQEKVSQFFSEKDLKGAKKLTVKLKNNYPEGYFVIVKLTLHNPKEFKTWYEYNRENEFEAADISIHEMTHGGTLIGCSYWIEDKCIKIKDEYFLLEKLFSGEVLLNYIEKPNFIDNQYLKENKQDITVTLDEVNAYIKSVRTTRVYKQHMSHPSTLARQLYILTLHLRHAKEVETGTWDAIVSNKGFAYTLMRLVKMAEAELETARTEGFSDRATVNNLKIYKKNKNYIDEYLVAAGIKELENLDLTYDELKQRGIGFTLEKI